MTDLGCSYSVILLGLFATWLQAKGRLRLDKDARRSLLIEIRNPFTPDYAFSCLHLFNLPPLQRIATTNSASRLLTPRSMFAAGT
ncbi:DUF2813 domain-containing protein [Shigella flexneri]